jgi:hypothetical protein
MGINPFIFFNLGIFMQRQARANGDFTLRLSARTLQKPDRIHAQSFYQIWGFNFKILK